MQAKTTFVGEMVDAGVLAFGDFTLKSGLNSPYFFNLGNISSGRTLANLGYVFAKYIYDLNLAPDILFGPAYKGIPLATATAIALSDMRQVVRVAFNRKERKEHGEGTNLMGAELDSARVLLLDDVVTDGATKAEAYDMIRANNGNPIGVLVALDRRELDPTGQRTMLQALEIKLDTPVYSIATLEDILMFLEHREMDHEYATIREYADRHCLLKLT
ncbi:MAG: orotate phosphoribosyltransferase [Gammaproteobacteria bacterium]|nr:orotate phosphoribosyltransferase [Gammaproteobacteria bacterium]MYD80487.1 orotate phosphoribosyltransferase [Gammaproteobacteria bacterium]